MKVGKQPDEYKKLTGNILKITSSSSPIEKAKYDYSINEGKFYTAINHRDAESLHKAGFHDWVRLKKGTIKEIFTKADCKRYEAFVQGYLLYFELNDNVTGQEDRTIYFDWNPKSGDDLIIYMKPLYMRNYHDYDAPMSPFPAPPSTVDPPKLPSAPPPTRS